MTSLTEFILARLAEDEAAVNDPRYVWSTDWPIGDPARVLAQCAALRVVVELHQPSPEYGRQACVLCQWDVDCESPKLEFQYYEGQATEWPCETLRALASIWADHEGWREEWAL